MGELDRDGHAWLDALGEAYDQHDDPKMLRLLRGAAWNSEHSGELIRSLPTSRAGMMLSNIGAEAEARGAGSGILLGVGIATGAISAGTGAIVAGSTTVAALLSATTVLLATCALVVFGILVTLLGGWLAWKRDTATDISKAARTVLQALPTNVRVAPPAGLPSASVTAAIAQQSLPENRAAQKRSL